MSSGKRTALEIAKPVAERLVALLSPACEWIAIAGSVRREEDHVGDIEIVCVPKIQRIQYTGKFNELHNLLDNLVASETFVKYAGVDKNGKSFSRWGDKYRALVFEGIKFDVFITDWNQAGKEYFIRTGPADMNQWLMRRINPKDWEKYDKKWNSAPFTFRDGGIWFAGRELCIPDESAWFQLLGIRPMRPPERTLAAIEERLPPGHRWPDPSEWRAQPDLKQLTLFDKTMFNELLVIEALERHGKLKADAKPTRPPYEWAEPWLDESSGKVWVPDGWEDGERQYKLVEIDSPEAERQRRYLGGFFHYADTIPLRAFIEKQRGEIPTPNYDTRYDLYQMLPYTFIEVLHESATVERKALPLDEIVCTQDTVSYHEARNYYRSTRLYDKAGNLPRVVKFLDTPHLLINGHHRYTACGWKGREKMHCIVEYIPMTLARAWDEENGVLPEEDAEVLLEVMEEVHEILGLVDVFA